MEFNDIAKLEVHDSQDVQDGITHTEPMSDIIDKVVMVEDTEYDDVVQCEVSSALPTMSHSRYKSVKRTLRRTASLIMRRSHSMRLCLK